MKLFLIFPMLYLALAKRLSLVHQIVGNHRYTDPEISWESKTCRKSTDRLENGPVTSS